MEVRIKQHIGWVFFWVQLPTAAWVSHVKFYVSTYTYTVLQFLISQIQSVTVFRMPSEIHAIRYNLGYSQVMNLLLQNSVSTCSFMSTYTVSAREFANEIESKVMYDPYSEQDPHGSKVSRQQCCKC
jgi:hypothetical protein